MNLRNMYIGASAGAGKTYQLVSRYITLLCLQKLEEESKANPNAEPGLRSIIATTFTNKAAGEFRARILESIAEAASAKPEKALEFWNDRISSTCKNLFANEAQIPQAPQDLKAFFTRLLREVMDHFNQLNLGTIDSLFQRIAASLSDELGYANVTPLAPEDEADSRRIALNATYEEKSDKGQELLEAIAAAIGEDAEMRHPDSNIFELISSYYEHYLNSPQAQWGGQPDEMSAEQLALFGLTKDDVRSPLTMEEMRSQAQQLTLLLLEDEEQNECSLFPHPNKDLAIKTEDYTKGWKIYPLGMSVYQVPMHPNSVKSYRSSFVKFVDSLLAPLSTELNTLSLPKGETGSPLEFMSQKRYLPYWLICEKKGIDLHAVVQTRMAAAWRQQLTRTQGIKELLAQFDEVYQREVRSRGELSFSDVARLLQGKKLNEELQLIEERIDAQLKHWLLDEFQDTSHQQFAIMKDMLEARADGGDEGSIFMVGDAKQSIYQFRGGDPSIFLKARSMPFGLQANEDSNNYSVALDLSKSYRSSPYVLDFANNLFGDHFIQHCRNASKAGIQKWRELNFKDHEAATDKKGCVEIWETADQYAADNEELEELSDTELIIQTMGEILRKARPHHTQRVLPSCAILVSTKQQGRDVFHGLNKLLKEEQFVGPICLSEDKLVGHDSPLGQALLQLFRWLQNSADRHSLTLLQLSPLWSSLQELGGEHPWAQLRNMLAHAGVGQFLRDLSQCSQGLVRCNGFMRQRWKIWFDAADAFDRSGGTPADWIRKMDEIAIRQQNEGNSISIMTIHKAKGLEFDMVLLPQLSKREKFTDYSKLPLIRQVDESGETKAVLLTPRHQLKEHPGFIKAMLEPWQANEEFAGFCKLYVAVTRAVHATYVILPNLDGKEGGRKQDSARHKILEEEVDNESMRGMFVQFADFYGYGAIYPDDIPRPDLGGVPMPHLAGNICHPYVVHWPEHREIKLGGVKIARCIYREGEDKWYKDFPQLATKPKNNRNSATASRVAYHFNSLARSTPSSLDKDKDMEQTLDLTNELPTPHSKVKSFKLGDLGGANFGTLVHELMEQVDWLGGGEPDWSLVDPMARRTAQNALNSAAWAPHLTRPTTPCRLMREQGMEAIMRGKWVSGIIDRLVVHYANGLDAPATSAQIFDFKTDRQPQEDTLKEEYRAQMRAYRELVALGFKLPQEAVSVTLLSCPAAGEANAWSYTAQELNDSSHY